jgi:suppressor of G2 allele of SKP1
MATSAPVTNVTPSYPSSSKTHKDWSKIDSEIEKDFAKEKPEGEAALNSLFKQIYDRSDENTRRAMIKSY